MESLRSFWPSNPCDEAPKTQISSKQNPDEMTQAESRSLEIPNQTFVSDSDHVTLEGELHVKKGRLPGQTSWVWKRRLVVFNFESGGSISIYRDDKRMPLTRSTRSRQPTSVLRTVYSKLHRGMSFRDDTKASLAMFIASDMPWIAKDVSNDPISFVVEIPTPHDNNSAALLPSRDHDVLDDEEINCLSDDDYDNDDGVSRSENGGGSREDKNLGADDLHHNLTLAQASGKPLRIYFRCDVGSNEKALWLKAFSKCGRLSNDTRMKKSIFASLTSTIHWGTTSRTRSLANERIAHNTRQLDMSEDSVDPNKASLTDHVEFLARGKGTGSDKEFRVLPSYAYPHRWLTKEEMRQEMVLPSEYFHDLRVKGCKEKEIGSLKVEVLQCLGLPKLDRVSDSDSVVYLVCGCYAFATDVIYNRTNPMWLRKTRRACEFPLFHGYARLYAGVFDDESRKVKDDFAGRVVIDVARLRPQSTYDVTLPLRLSTHVYSRRKRGALRLRLTLNWYSERSALMSYLPNTLRIPLPQHSAPNYRTTVMCSDQKAFRNIAITVHGAHLPGRFTFNQMRAAIREINFTRKCVVTGLQRNFRDTRQWRNPAMSSFVFLSWMHCIFANTFSLVPAYFMLYFFLMLMRNYAKYGMDGPTLRGFIPPSWEELFMALVWGKDPDYHAIEPLELGFGSPPQSRRKLHESNVRSGRCSGMEPQWRVTTHEPKGKRLLRALGFLPEGHCDPDEHHLEFPFADGKDYPKFTVEECLVAQGKTHSRVPSGSGSCLGENSSTVLSNITDDEHRSRVMPRFPIDMDLQRMMRKDSSGTRDYDEEEDNFAARKAVISQGRKAASKMTKTATALSSKTGLDYVVKPLHYGISSGVSHMSSGVGHVSSVAGSMTSHVMSMPSEMRRRASIEMHRHDAAADPFSGVESTGGKAETRQRRRMSNGTDLSRNLIYSGKPMRWGGNGIYSGDFNKPLRKDCSGAEVSGETIDKALPPSGSTTSSDVFRQNDEASRQHWQGRYGVDVSSQQTNPSIPLRPANLKGGLDHLSVDSFQQSWGKSKSSELSHFLSGESNNNCLTESFVAQHESQKDNSSDPSEYNGTMYRQRQPGTHSSLSPSIEDTTTSPGQRVLCEPSELVGGVFDDRNVQMPSKYESLTFENNFSRKVNLAYYVESDGSGNSEFEPFYESEPDELNAEIGPEGDVNDSEIDPAFVFPEQNIDIQGPSTGKKLTDDLAEIKDKMHELTWHLFDDHTYVVKNPDALFFGESGKPAKRKKSDTSKKLNKYLHMGQYSHSNPFVARVGMYVEPIIGSTYSILCLFRAGFNIATWRDPMLTFWVSLVSGIISIILFFFPWRIFLFIVGVVLVGPQNWVIRILREQGRLPPAPKFSRKKAETSASAGENYSDLPADKPVFTKNCRIMSGNDSRKPIDPSVDAREIHHVVVPYSPLFHQRCNDWPPEPQYACVERKADANDAEANAGRTAQYRRSTSLGSEHSSTGETNARFGRLRRRLLRSKQTPLENHDMR